MGAVAEAEAVADGVTDPVGLGAAVGVVLADEVLGVGVPGALLRAGGTRAAPFTAGAYDTSTSSRRERHGQ